MSAHAPQNDVTDEHIHVGDPKHWAVGVPGVMHASLPAIDNMGLTRAAKLLTSINQKDGFDCMSCAWPDPAHRKVAEFCENGAKAVTWEATPLLIPSTFWAEHTTTELFAKSEYWLGLQGRLTDPLIKYENSEHYVEVSWDEAYRVIGDELKALKSPDEASFYTSGRASNEAAFIYQLFVRAFGTNNLPDCSNMCHESSGVAMISSIGVGKASISLDDFNETELVIVMGQNPGTNHPRMLTSLEEAKQKGAAIVSVNPLPEAGLERYKNPQTVRGVLGNGTQISDQFVQVRLGGDFALLQLLARRVVLAEQLAPGTVIDHEFIQQHTSGFDAYIAHLLALEEAPLMEAAGVSEASLAELAERYIRSQRTIITWAMGLTQHVQSVDTIKEALNLLFLRGNIGRPGAGACPVRGHSNVQGDRTMGIWEKAPDSFLDALGTEFSFQPPRKHGFDAVETVEAMRDGKVGVWIGLGGNFASAISDTHVAQQALQSCRLTVNISTKLNRSHAAPGAISVILPTLGRTEIDTQLTGDQFVTVEDSVCVVHPSRGKVAPVAPNLRSEVSIIAGIAQAALGETYAIPWSDFANDYDTIRDRISRVVPGCENYNSRVREDGGFVMAHGPRDSRTFPTASGKANFNIATVEPIALPKGRLILQTLRSHDQYNTTIYGMNDRYRGIKKGRQVIFINPDDISDLGLADGDHVNIYSEWKGQPDRELRDWRVVSYPTARGCAAAYFPEANVLIPLQSVARESNTPVSKAIIVRLEATGENTPR
jgi:molybdopterin-dependent oxidoreductase alpha subunit